MNRLIKDGIIVHMKTWDYGINSLHKTGYIWFEEAPWYIFAIDSFTTWLCDYFPPIPFPAIGMTDEDGEKTTWKEYKELEINKTSISPPYFRNL